MVTIELNRRNVLLGALYIFIAYWLIVGTIGFLAQRHTNNIANTLCPPTFNLEGVATPIAYKDQSYFVGCSYDALGQVELRPREGYERPIMRFIFSPLYLLSGNTCAAGFGFNPRVQIINGEIVLFQSFCDIVPLTIAVPGVGD